MPESLGVIVAQGENGFSLTGTNAIVILGPNGSGKTRHAVEMAGWNNADHIGAVRNIQLRNDVNLRSTEQANKELFNTLSGRRKRYWELSNEIDQLFTKLLAENYEAAVTYRDGMHDGESPALEVTKLMLLRDAWKRMYPGREIVFKGNQPKVVNQVGSVTEYSAEQMSDGERVGLYLAGRALDAKPGIVIVDEPEVHFHGLLAVRFWNELESLRPDCRFVYVTHDLPFALSRREASFVMVMPESGPQLLELQKGLPNQLIEALLGAASFSIHARRIIFCEGMEGQSIDSTLYSAWFSEQGTAVVPVGSSQQVVSCIEAFGNSKLVAGVDAVGIVDRDYWPDSYLCSLATKLHVLPVHEVENLFCVEEVFKSVAKHQAIPDADERFQQFRTQARKVFDAKSISYQISMRYRRGIDHLINTASNGISVDSTPEINRSTHVRAFDSSTWPTAPDDVYDREHNTVNDAIDGPFEEFNRVLPGKMFVNLAAKSLGLTTDAYIGLVTAALAHEGEGHLSQLRNELMKALAGYLPPRKHRSSAP